MSSRENKFDPRNTTLAILAGGAGSRMGQPKALLRIAGKPILEWLLKRVAWTGPTMLVTAPAISDPPGAALFGKCVIDPCDGQGPLRGILTALENLTTETMVAIPVDMPNIGATHLRWLVDSLIANPKVLGVMCRIPATGQIEPFPSAFRSSARKSVAARIARNQLSVRELCNDAQFAAVDAPSDWTSQVWTNLNSPQELNDFESSMPQTLEE